ncbi:Gfo/Idh/MocA family oxidoreductase [Paracoccus liaowanqingii]|uniref:Gfo/Idh/MocA family oxidoreductase n=1 Tax=Paracoccus liaowanqingii TaxID=2560053 RepID=A0A4Z1C4H8_9RHOB|nr:Gfo/Idh/MocA family oxidoreductase [Paracoccus liaowanqingii]TGN42977.1 Gfo/Idh/MocA family oxidoreductase [Paracoccus liaowanqingii]
MKTFAIVGLGMALAPHMASLADLKDRARLAHAVTRSPARRAAFEAAYGIPATGDLDMALADPAVDAVILLTPPDSHRDLGRRILAAGKHLLIEKPAGLVTDDTRFLADMAGSSGLLAAPVLQHRFRPAIRAVAAALASGAFGRLCGVHCLIPWWRPQSYYDAPGRGTYARDGGGVLLTQAVHTLDVLRALCGGATITAAQAVTSPLHRMEAEDLVCALATFGPDAAPGTIMATTACSPGMTETMTLILERATIRIEGLRATVFHADGRVEDLGGQGASGSSADPMAFDHASHRDLIAAFLDALEGRAPLAVDLSDLIATREMIDVMT